MKKAFTLLELLVVMGIMGLMGTLSIGGYRAMQRGMEERGVMQSVNTMIREAYQRAQIDRQPVAIYFWSEKLGVEAPDSWGMCSRLGRYCLLPIAYCLLPFNNRAPWSLVPGPRSLSSLLTPNSSLLPVFYGMIYSNG